MTSALLFQILFAVVCGSNFLMAGPTFAQTTDDETPEPYRLTLVSQSTTVAPGNEQQLEFSAPQLRSVPPGATVETSVFSIADSVQQLQAPSSGLLNRLPAIPADGLVDENKLTIAIPVRGPGTTDSNNAANAEGIPSVFLPDEGVYPIVVEVVSDGQVIAEGQSTLIRTTAEETNDTEKQPLASLIIDVTENGIALDEIVLLTQPDSAVFIVDEATLRTLEDDPQLAQRFSRLVSTSVVVVSIGQHHNLSALAAIGQQQLFFDRLRTLRRQATTLGLPVNNSSTRLSLPPTQSAIDALAAEGIRWLILLNSSAEIQQAPSDATNPVPPVQTMISGDGADIAVLQPLHTPNGSADQTDLSNPTEFVHSLLANTAVASPKSTEPLVFQLDRGNGLFLDDDYVSALLAADSVLFNLGPVEDLTSLGDPTSPAPSAALDLAPVSMLAASVHASISTYESSYKTGEESPTDFRNQLLESLSTDTPPSQRNNDIEQLQATIGDKIQSIDMPDGQAVTVAARSAPVPLTLTNTSDGIRKVLVRVDSDKVDIAQDDQVIEVLPGGQSVELDVQVRTLGVSPVQVSLFTPDGKSRLASTRFEVRSTALPGVGLLLCVIGGLVLCVWWYVHARNQQSRTDNSSNEGNSEDPNGRQRSWRRADGMAYKRQKEQTSDPPPPTSKREVAP